MSCFKHILACLDLTGMDNHIIKYTAFLGEQLKCKDITFLHVVQAYDLPDQSNESYQNVKISMYDYIEKEINKLLSKQVRSNINIKIVVSIAEKDASDVMISYVRKNKVSLAVFGKKAEEIRKERYSARAIALSECDVLVVPENPPMKLERLFLAIDLSKASNEAFKVAKKIKKRTKADLKGQYVYELPKSYFPITSKETMFDYIRKKMNKKVKHYKKQSKPDFNGDDFNTEIFEYENQGEQVIRVAEEQQSDMVIIGAKGRASAPTTLLGKLSEDLRKIKSNLPVLIIKNFWEKNSFWNIFFHG